MSGECYKIPFDEITYGGRLTGKPYCNDVIDIGLNVDSCEEFIQIKKDDATETLIDELSVVLNKYRSY